MKYCFFFFNFYLSNKLFYAGWLKSIYCIWHSVIQAILRLAAHLCPCKLSDFSLPTFFLWYFFILPLYLTPLFTLSLLLSKITLSPCFYLSSQTKHLSSRRSPPLPLFLHSTVHFPRDIPPSVLTHFKWEPKLVKTQPPGSIQTTKAPVTDLKLHNYETSFKQAEGSRFICCLLHCRYNR